MSPSICIFFQVKSNLSSREYAQPNFDAVLSTLLFCILSLSCYHLLTFSFRTDATLDLDLEAQLRKTAGPARRPLIDFPRLNVHSAAKCKKSAKLFANCDKDTESQSCVPPSGSDDLSKKFDAVLFVYVSR